MDFMDGGSYHSVNLVLNADQYKKYMNREGFQITHEELQLTKPSEKGGTKLTLKAHEIFHKKYLNALKKKKNLRVNKTYYDMQLEGSKKPASIEPAAKAEPVAKKEPAAKKEPKKKAPVIKKEKKKRAKKITIKEPDSVVIPSNGNLLKDVPVVGEGLPRKKLLFVI